MNSSKSNYIPGMCNIGPAERRMRRVTGFMSLSSGIILLIILVMTDVSSAWRLLLFIPFTVAASGFLQDAFHFCAAFGIKGVYNVINSQGVTDNVELEEYRKKDVRKAGLIISLSVGIGIAATALAFLV